MSNKRFAFALFGSVSRLPRRAYTSLFVCLGVVDVLVVVIIKLWIFQAVTQANPDAKRLYDDLLSNYNKLVRPVANVSDALAVKIKLKLSQLIDVVTTFFLYLLALSYRRLFFCCRVLFCFLAFCSFAAAAAALVVVDLVRAALFSSLLLLTRCSFGGC